MTERAMDWNGAERRSGDDRRVAVMEREDERRHGERRRGGIGTERPNPLESLLEGIDTPDASEVQARQAAAAAADGRPTIADAGDRSPEGDHDLGARARNLAARLRPEHESDHGAVPSLAAIGGHPLHPVVVPLPIGAFMGALASDVALAATGDRFFARASRLLTGTAVATGAVAGALGAVDFVGRGKVRSHTAAWVHAGGNLAALGLGIASLALRATARDERRAVLPAGLAMSVAAGALLLVTGWLGGELSYRHRIGVVPGDDA